MVDLGHVAAEGCRVASRQRRQTPGSLADRLSAIERRKVTDDRELFESYRAIAEAAHDVVAGHLAELHRQVGAIIADGIAARSFASRTSMMRRRAVLDATARVVRISC